MSEQTGKLLLRLVLILAERASWGCDNVRGNPRPDCQCHGCEGWRLFSELDKQARATVVTEG